MAKGRPPFCLCLARAWDCWLWVPVLSFFVLLTTDAMYCWVPSFSTSAAECRSTCVFLTFFFLALQSETIYFRYSYLEQVSLAGCFLTHVGFCQHPLCPCRHKLHSFGRRIQRLWLRSHSCINN